MAMAVKVDLRNLTTQKALRKAGIRWTLRNYERNNLEVSEEAAVKLGLKAAAKAPTAMIPPPAK